MFVSCPVCDDWLLVTVFVRSISCCSPCVFINASCFSIELSHTGHVSLYPLLYIYYLVSDMLHSPGTLLLTFSLSVLRPYITTVNLAMSFPKGFLTQYTRLQVLSVRELAHPYPNWVRQKYLPDLVCCPIQLFIRV